MAQKLEPAAEEPDQAWRDCQGLASLLDYAKHHLPERDPWDLPEVSDSGLGRLLREARAHLQSKEVE